MEKESINTVLDKFRKVNQGLEDQLLLLKGQGLNRGKNLTLKDEDQNINGCHFWIVITVNISNSTVNKMNISRYYNEQN